MESPDLESIPFVHRIFKDDGRIPNHPKLPLVLYPGVFEGIGSEGIAKRFQENSWQGCWVNGVFSWHHFHSTAHEVLGCFSGSARVKFGGESGEAFDIRTGDAVMIPAGVGHKNLDSSPDFGVVGAYPAGQQHDLGKGEAHERPWILKNIKAVPLPAADPVFGGIDTPLMRLWRRDPGQTQ